jgi:hypothetical protein
MLNFIILNLFITIINGFVINGFKTNGFINGFKNRTLATTVTSSEWSKKSIKLDGNKLLPSKIITNNLQESRTRYFLTFSNDQSLIASLDS